jgi:protocatechuate 3,4-dioxygenase beta subunit
MQRWLSVTSLMTVSALAPSANAQPPVAPEPPKFAHVSGVVVDLDSGRPLRRAMVCFNRNGDAGYTGPGTSHCDETDLQGRFALTNLPPARYSYGVTREGYSGADPLADKLATLIALNSGDELSVKLRMQRLGSILGRVVFEDGEPFPGADLQLNRGSGGRVKTNNSGEFRFDNLTPGDYRVQLNHPAVLSCDGPSNLGARLYVPQAEGVGDPTVHVGLGQETRVPDIVLVERMPHRITGRIVWDTYPLPGILARILTGNGTIMANNSDGSFAACGLAPGEYTLRTIGTIDGRSFAGDLNIRVGDEDLKDLEIRPELSAFLRARILVEDHAEDKVPLDLSAANIYAITEGAAPHDSYPQPRRQSDGSFILEELYSWEYRFVLSPLPSGSYIKSARIGQTDVMDTPLLVHAGEHLDDLIFTVSLKAGVVNGTVQDENANPVPGATVILQPDPRHRDRDPHECWRTADQNGGFNCDNLAPGKYRIAAWRTDPEFPQALNEVAASGTPIEVSEGGRASIVVNVQK